MKSAETFWEKDLQAPSEIMCIIKNGYEIPFISPPRKYEKRNNKSAISNESFATVSLSSERVIKLFNKLYQFKKSPFMTTKVVALIVGSVVSMKLILGDPCSFLNPVFTDISKLQGGNDLSLDKNSGF